MPLPEGYLPREGDVLVLHGTVKYDVVPKEDTDADGIKVFVRLKGDFQDRRVPLKDVVGVFARKWDTGARVRINGDDEDGSGEVLAVHDAMVWIKYSRPGCSDMFGTYDANELLPAPDPIDEPFVE